MKKEIRDLHSSIAKLRREGGPLIPDGRLGSRAKWSVLALLLGLAAVVTISCVNPAASGTSDITYKPILCLAPTCEEVKVKSGDVTLSVPAVGSLRYSNNAYLRFQSSARVISVNVKVGDVVREGQVLASLYPASLELAVAAAIVSVREAEEALEKILEPHTSEELRVAETAVDEARLEVDSAMENLMLAEAGATEQELAEARLYVRRGEFDLQENRKDLEDFMAGPTAQEIAGARQIEARAEVALKEAESALASLAEDMNQQLTQLRQEKADTEVALDQNLDNLDDFELDYEKKLAQALRTEADAEATLLVAENILTQFTLSLGNTLVFDDEALGLLRRLTVSVEQAQANLNVSSDDVAELIKGPDPLLRRQLEVAAEVDRAMLEQIQKDLGIPENSAATLEPRRSQSAVEAAQTDLTLAEAALQDVHAVGNQQDVLLWENRVAAARANLQAAALGDLSPQSDNAEGALQEATISAAAVTLVTEEESLAAIKAGVDPLEVELQVADVVLARADLEDAIQELLKLQSGPDPIELALKDAQVVLSQAILVEARENLTKLTSGPAPEQVEQARIALTLAQVTLLESEEELRLLKEKPEEIDVGLARKAIEVELDRLAVAEGNLKALTIVAPFDGIVSTVNLISGQMVKAVNGLGDDTADNLIQLMDISALEMVALVDESDVGLVAIGQEATISVNALPEHVVHGRVSDISAVAITQEQDQDSDSALYEVIISAAVGPVPDLKLMEGMNASVDILIDRRANVLYIPPAALIGVDQPSVELVADGTVTSASVTTGLINHRRAEIKEGLEEGDTVRVDRSKGNVRQIIRRTME